TVGFRTPSAVADEDMYSIRSTPLLASSRGVATVCDRTAGFAPGYRATTEIVGGETSGYSLIARPRMAMMPAAITIRDSTTAKIGRSMKNREKRTMSSVSRANAKGLGDESSGRS